MNHRLPPVLPVAAAAAVGLGLYVAGRAFRAATPPAPPPASAPVPPTPAQLEANDKAQAAAQVAAQAQRLQAARTACEKDRASLGGGEAALMPACRQAEILGAEAEGRSLSAAKVEWHQLKDRCDENMARRDAGFTGRLEPYCTQAETLREQATGIEDSTAPGATQF